MCFPKSSSKSTNKQKTSTSALYSSTTVTGSISELQMQSTNVSSPPRNARQALTRTGGPQEANSHSRHFINGYEDDGFVVDDDEDDEYGPPPDVPDDFGFMPVREGGRSGATMRGSNRVGRPIRGDPELARLSEYEKDVLNRFMVDAKRLRAKIMRRQGWERVESVLEDRQMRTIGIRLPTGMFICPIVIFPIANLENF